MQRQPFTIQFWSALVCALLALPACQDEAEPATALVLSVKSDLDDLAQVEVRVFPRDADPRTGDPDQAHSKEVEAHADEPVSVVIKQGSSQQVMLAVLALDGRGKKLAEVRKRAAFTKGKTIAVPIYLSSRCLNVTCDTEKLQTCYPEDDEGHDAGECGPIPALSQSGLFEVVAKGDEHEKWDPMKQTGDAAIEMDAASKDAGQHRSDAAEDGATERSLDAGRDGAADASNAAPSCSKPALSAATCGLSPQCGCATNQACYLSGAQTTACSQPGQQPSQTRCESNGDCALGLSCIGSRCTPYCQVDADCGNGGVCANINIEGNPIPGANGCLVACNPASGAPCGAGLSCAHLKSAVLGGRTVTGDFCLKPSSPCPRTSDGTCDESRGTRLCADGTDTADCAAEQACAADRSCPSGSVCGGGLCRKVCTSDAQCNPGAKCGIAMGATSGYCFSTCNSATPNAGCPSGQICSNGSSGSGTCVKPESPCPYLDDGTCDDQSGTRWCAAGSDVVDCAPATCATSSPNGPCDLVSQCGCSKAQACVLNNISNTGVVGGTCGTAGSVASGATCTTGSECDKGYLCFKGTCRRYCRVNADCVAPLQCKGLTYTLEGDAGVVNVQQLGACLP